MAPSTQKALVIPAKHAPFQLATDWPVTKPGLSDVLIRLVSVGLNPVDAYLKAFGGGPPLVPGYPFILGYDGAGVIEEVGSEVTNITKGDRVYVSAFGWSLDRDRRYPHYASQSDRLVCGGFDNSRATFKEYLTFPAREVVKVCPYHQIC